jgi:hypothetical protein
MHDPPAKHGAARRMRWRARRGEATQLPTVCTIIRLTGFAVLLFPDPLGVAKD